MKALHMAGVTMAAALVGIGLPGEESQAATGPRYARAVDGDTLRLGNGRSVRLIGVDTPEVGECGYGEAKARMARLTSGGVTLTNRSGTDRYGRILAYAKTRDGRDIGTVMLRRGLAVARYDSRDGYAWHPRQGMYRTLDSRNGTISCASTPRTAPQSVTPVATPTPTTTPTTAPSTPPPVMPPATTQPPVSQPTSVYYRNCDAARAAGAAPIYSGQPGYGRHLDRDGDGVGCE
jgi:hypothetical protein